MRRRVARSTSTQTASLAIVAVSLFLALPASADTWTTANGGKITTQTTTTRVGVGITGNNNVANMLDVEGGAAIGATFSGTSAAPANGLIVQGNVGLGTATVANRLDVEGGAAIGASFSGTNAAPSNGLIVQGRVGVGTNNPGAGLEVSSNTASQSAFTANQLQAGVHIARFRQNGVNRLVITDQGRIGIGTDFPTEHLDIEGGNIYVQGYVQADGGLQVKGWKMQVPDYVFDDKDPYKLMALGDLERFVKKHKHLPEVPSADDLAKNGMNVGDMNLLLLKKVEELTLHVIAQDKKLRRLANANRNFTKRK
jgi:hypothetical protein